jgi:hypothetical protein
MLGTRLLIGLIVILAMPRSLLAQTSADTLDAATAVERALERTDAATTSAELAEWLSDRVLDPLDLNTASVEDLARLPGLTPLAAQRIVAHRKTEGPFTRLAELQELIDLDERAFDTLRPFLTAHPSSEAPTMSQASWLRRIDGRLIQRVTRRLDVGRGYDSDTTRTTYTGSPERLYTRLQLQSGRRLQLNLTLEKDPGEAFRWAPADRTYGFDHLSAHAVLRGVGPIETLVLGDYSAAFGQGVGLWHSFSFSKGRDVIAPAVRRGNGLTPFSSTEENRFFRGLGATVRVHRHVSITAFGSRRTLDATTTDDENGDDVPSTRTTSGLHRTPTEQANKDVLHEALAGGAANWHRGALRFGIAGYHSRTDRPLASPTAPYRRFAPTAARHTTLTAYGSTTWGDVYGFGEWTRAHTDWGGIAGVQIDKDIAEAVVSMRHYPAAFSPLHGRAYGEGGDPPQNETGVYIATRFRPSADWQIGAYLDQYRFPWLRFATPRPSAGHDVRLVVDHTPRPWFTYYVQVRSERSEEGTSIAAQGRTVKGVRAVTRQSVRLHGEYAFNDRLEYRTRVEGVRVRRAASRSTGVLLYHGIRWRPTDWLRLDTRWALFDTDDFAARLYAYEYDLLYAFAIPAFSGQGSRQYLLAQITPTSRLRVEVKYGSTRYQNTATVGSGLDEVAGSQLRSVKAQLRWRF